MLGSFHLLLTQAVFHQGIVFAIDLHRTQGDNFAAAGVDDANVFALEDARENGAQPLAGLGSSHCLHTLIILSSSGKARGNLNPCPGIKSLFPVRSALYWNHTR